MLEERRSFNKRRKHEIRRQEDMEEVKKQSSTILKLRLELQEARQRNLSVERTIASIDEELSQLYIRLKEMEKPQQSEI